MAPTKRCLICLNYLKRKKKKLIRPPNTPEETRVILFFLRKLAWSPVPLESLQRFFGFGKPTEWAGLCNICEKEVKRCLDMHREIGRMIKRITDIRKKLYQENFYEVEEDEEESGDEGEGDGDSGHGKKVAVAATPPPTPEDCRGTKDIFNHLRHQLFSEFKEGGQTTRDFNKSVVVEYMASSDVRMRRRLEPGLATPSEQNGEVAVKMEHFSDEDEADSESSDDDDDDMDGGVLDADEDGNRFNSAAAPSKDAGVVEESSPGPNLDDLMEEDPDIPTGGELESSDVSTSSPGFRKKRNKRRRLQDSRPNLEQSDLSGSMLAKGGSQKRHPVWQYFSYDGPSHTSKCLIRDCGKVISKGYTTNLKKHLQSRHHIILGTLGDAPILKTDMSSDI